VVSSLPDTSPSQLELGRRVQFAYPGDFWANNNLGTMLEAAGKHAEAIRYHTAALALRPDNPGVLVNRANALLNVGERAASMADAQRAIEIAPRYATAYNCLGNALLEQFKFDAAIVAYRTAIKLDPDATHVHNNLGLALAGQNKLDDAIAAYRKATEYDSANWNVYSRLGEAYARRGQWDQSAVAYGRALALDTKATQEIAHNPDPGQLAYQGPRLLLADDTDGYRRLCARVIGKHGDTRDPPTAYLVARLCALAPGMVPEPARLVQIAEQAVRAARLPHYLHTLGLVHYRAGQFDDAIVHLHNSRAGKWNANAANWIVLAMAYQRCGRTEEAQRWFDMAVHWMDDRGGIALRLIHGHDALACMVLRREAETQLGLRSRPAAEGNKALPEKKPPSAPRSPPQHGAHRRRAG
jgi:tetratricopeptide (TPR) repeat protein